MNKLPPLQPRWYCVDSNGVATLCANEEDAILEACMNSDIWPENAPYRAVLLGDVAAEPAASKK
jgi:hypothetical protein